MVHADLLRAVQCAEPLACQPGVAMFLSQQVCESAGWSPVQMQQAWSGAGRCLTPPVLSARRDGSYLLQVLEPL